MRRASFVFVLATALAASGCPRGPAPAPARPTAKDIVARSKPGIVRVEASGDRVGTGFVIGAEGVIVTNLHVVAGSPEIAVVLLDQSRVVVTQVIAFDAARDLALLRVTMPVPMTALTLGDSDVMAAGDSVLAIGNPLGVLDYSVSDGLVSSIRPISDDLTMLQISAPISQGSSGGPVFNAAGEVIGVATGIFAEGQNLNFAVPSNYVRALAAQPAANLAVPAFAQATRPADAAPTDGPKIVRRVPIHDTKVLAGCTKTHLGDMAGAILQAIEVGAPLYNAGNHEACFRVYEGVVIKLEAEPPCPGVRAAAGDGLLRAQASQNYTERAWIMRDTFDGLLDVIRRQARSMP